ncbi:Crp/Fnr family transcriptional regulator [Mucilaginibacter paludis]|uniref:Cyclic nucleotide-binding protein n=1 Tax=Mucilaginibacter paludis DSM 18603 TaxID=714943 RepID=H1YHM4_9SPHI|nr:cyclic nucleotide-binding domain-containing protein [Mucilaginibacter paludis]EHQ26447.1 cyclic nucleotide-binding protein [Mucilaginibacter paludis DSM 18603]
MKKHHPILNRLYKLYDTYKPQSAATYAYLDEVIGAKFYPEDEILYVPGEIIDQIFFLASGNMVAYNFTDSGDKQVLQIYRENEHVAGQSFTRQIPSTYYLMVCAGSYTLQMTRDQLDDVYRKFPETQELGRIRLSTAEEKEVRHKQLLFLPGIQMVETFYKEYPELIEPGKVLRDRDIASYLLLAEGSLRDLRNRLLREGLLKLPAKEGENTLKYG